MSLEIVKPRGMGHDSLKTVGKTCRIIKARRIQISDSYPGAVLHRKGEDRQPNHPMKK